MNIKGKINLIGKINVVSDTFRKREFVIEYEGESKAYPEYLKMDLTQDKTELIDNFKVGDTVEVFFNLRGRPWTNQEGVTTYYNFLHVYNIINDN